MELAFILIVLVISELVISVWMLARHRSYLRRLKDMESNVSKLAEVLQDVVKDMSKDDVAEIAKGYKEQATALAMKATPEELEQAREILDKLGIE